MNVCKEKSILILAPMQGLLDPVMRRLLTDIGGYSECVTEFVRIVSQIDQPNMPAMITT